LFLRKALAKVNILASDDEWQIANSITADDMTPSVRFILANQLVSGDWSENDQLPQQVLDVLSRKISGVKRPHSNAFGTPELSSGSRSSSSSSSSTVSGRPTGMESLEAGRKFNEAMCELFKELENASGAKKAFLEKRMEAMQAQFSRDFP
jgi:hypothetical protein